MQNQSSTSPGAQRTSLMEKGGDEGSASGEQNSSEIVEPCPSKKAALVLQRDTQVIHPDPGDTGIKSKPDVGAVIGASKSNLPTSVTDQCNDPSNGKTSHMTEVAASQQLSPKLFSNRIITAYRDLIDGSQSLSEGAAPSELDLSGFPFSKPGPDDVRAFDNDCHYQKPSPIASLVHALGEQNPAGGVLDKGEADAGAVIGASKSYQPSSVTDQCNDLRVLISNLTLEIPSPEPSPKLFSKRLVKGKVCDDPDVSKLSSSSADTSPADKAGSPSVSRGPDNSSDNINDESDTLSHSMAIPVAKKVSHQKFVPQMFSARFSRRQVYVDAINLSQLHSEEAASHVVDTAAAAASQSDTPAVRPGPDDVLLFDSGMKNQSSTSPRARRTSLMEKGGDEGPLAAAEATTAPIGSSIVKLFIKRR